MAEFTSKKILPVIEILGSESIPTTVQYNRSFVECLVESFIKYQELEQDFVTHARSSRTKIIWIGIGLCVISLVTGYIWFTKIRPLV